MNPTQDPRGRMEKPQWPSRQYSITNVITSRDYRGRRLAGMDRNGGRSTARHEKRVTLCCCYYYYCNTCVTWARQRKTAAQGEYCAYTGRNAQRWTRLRRQRRRRLRLRRGSRIVYTHRSTLPFD